MIIVSGLRRSGTSMLMLALKRAGFKIAGTKFSGKNRKGNPNGYWEIPDICKDTGLVEEIDGEVIKIMFEALPFSKPELIDKVIVIFREPKQVLYSMLKDNKIEYLDIFVAKQLLDIVDTFKYLLWNNILCRMVFYDDILDNPYDEMSDICEFLGKGNFKKAAKVVDVELNRSKDATQVIRLWDRIYKLIRQGNIIDVLKFDKKIEELSKDLITKLDKCTK